MVDEAESIKHPKTEEEYAKESAHLQQAAEQVLHMKTQEERVQAMAKMRQELEEMTPAERKNVAVVAGLGAELGLDSNQYAGLWRRAGAYLLDVIIFVVATGILGLVFRSAQLAEVTQMVWPILLIYYTCFECSPLQGTPGKMVLGIVVTDLAGRRISFIRALLRFVSKALSFLFLGFGFIMCGFTKRRQCLHDMIVGTLVVKKDAPFRSK